MSDQPENCILTPASDLDDTDLCVAVAREVLGWKDVRPYTGIHPCAWGIAEGSSRLLRLHWAGIYRVNNALDDRDLYLSIANIRTTYTASIRNKAMQTITRTQNPNPPRAVFEAALNAVRRESDDE